jgi:NADPH:quinone reductase-like Zn-dependent oxidoreductase
MEKGEAEGDLLVRDSRDGVVLIAEGFRLARLAGREERPEDLLYRLEWREASPSSGGVSERACSALTGGGELSTRVARRLGASPVAPELPAGGQVVFDLRSLDEPEIPDPERIEAGVLGLAHLIRELAGMAPAPRLVVVTRGAVATAPGAALLPGQAALWGLARTAAGEHPELECTRIDLPSEPSAADLDLLAQGWAEHGPEAAVREGAWLVPALVRATARPEVEVPRREPAQGRPFAAVLERPGDLDRIAFRPVVPCAPGLGEVEIEVEAVGLNFLNVLSGLGLYPGAPGGFRSLGIECAGWVTRVGPGAGRLSPGDPVFGLADDCLASFALARADLLARKPEGLSFAEAATVPVAFLTAFHALQEVARLAEGETVLIHSAAGGVGIAAVQLARRAGAEVLATAGTEEKRALLRTMGIRHVFDSRSLEFAQGVLDATGGRGVDVVLNSLAGAAMRRSLELLAPFGRFLEIGKRDLHDPRGSRLELGLLRHGASYTAIDLDRLAKAKPALLGRLLGWIAERLAAGELEPLPRQEIPFARAADAFRRMAEGRHVGKLVLTPSAEEMELEGPALHGTPIHEDGTYLITGGLGALGLTFADWLLARGAGAVALLGRSAPGREALERLVGVKMKHGGRVEILQADVADEASLAQALEQVRRDLPPLRGVLHAAGILDDRSLLHLDEASCRRVLAPKVRGAWNLHHLTAGDDLDLFVLFASAAGLFGSPGQASYAAGNAFLDGLAAWRRSRSLPALAVDWGPVAEIGLAARADGNRRLEEEGLFGLDAGECPALLEAALRSSLPQVAAVRVDRATFSHPLLAETAADGGPAESPLARRLAALASPADRLDLLGEHIAGELARVLRCPVSEVAADIPFKTLGLDSLQAIQATKRIGEGLGISLSVTTFWTYPTLRQYRDFLAETLAILPEADGRPSAPSPQAAPTAADDAAWREIDELTDEEAEHRLLEKLSAAQV